MKFGFCPDCFREALIQLYCHFRSVAVLYCLILTGAFLLVLVHQCFVKEARLHNRNTLILQFSSKAAQTTASLLSFKFSVETDIV